MSNTLQWPLTMTTTHFLPPRCTELYPVEIDVAEASPRDARHSMVVILVYVDVERRVHLHVVSLPERPQSVLYAGVGEPLLQLRRPHRVVDDTLRGTSQQAVDTFVRVYVQNDETLDFSTYIQAAVCMYTEFAIKIWGSNQHLTDTLPRCLPVRKRAHFAPSSSQFFPGF